jgi:capsular exopolysaccharide synthesis family protein
MSYYYQGPRELGNEPAAFDLKRSLRILAKRKWLALAFFLAVMAAVLIHTKRQKPIYEAQVIVLIERTPPRVLTGTAEVVELGSNNYWSNKEYYQTQYSIIRSQEIAMRVVERLGLQHDSRLLEAIGAGNEDEPFQRSEMDAIAEMLSDRITVSPVKDSMLVEVALEDEDPVFAAEIVNAVAQSYRDYNLDHKHKAVAEADRELEVLVAERLTVKEAAETAIVNFESAESVGTISNKRKVIDQTLLSGEIELDALRRYLDEAQARMNALRRYRGTRDVFSVAAPEVMGNLYVQQLKREYVQMEGEMARLSTRYLGQHPEILAVQDRMTVLSEKARLEIRNIVKAASIEVEKLKARKRSLSKRLEASRAADLALADRQIAHDRLLAIRGQARQAFDKLKKRLMETRMTGQIHVNNVDILDMARVPISPIRPNVRMNLLLGMILGMMGGVVLALFVEFMDNTVKSREDIEEQIGLAFLGLVPTLRDDRRTRQEGEEYEGKKELFVHYRPMSTVAEFSRSIRTNLLFVTPDKTLRTLLVTSPNPQEGKTTIAVNVGITMAASGGRVVIVDTDMRRPRLHEAFWDHRPATGLSNYLIGAEPVGRYVQRTVVDRLDILPCGPCPPNPAELIHTEKFKALIAELQQDYETVIFDSPPVNLVTDAQILGNIVDGVVIVAKCGKTTRDAVLHSRRQLEQVNARILGCVLNDLDLESRSYGYYHYQHDPYGQGYAEDDGIVSSTS